MAKYTENFNLIKPEDDEYYDVADFNENMDKIGEPEDSILSTVFGKLNGFISPDGKGVRIVKSIQRIDGVGTNSELSIQPVDPARCIVLSERLYNYSNYLSSYSYTLEANVLKVNISTGGSQNCTVGFWIIEFY